MPFLIAKESRCIPLNMQTCSVTESCPAVCDPMDCSPPSSSVHGIVLVRIQKWATMSFSWIFPSQGSNLGNPKHTHTHGNTHTCEHSCRERTRASLSGIRLLPRSTAVPQLARKWEALWADLLGSDSRGCDGIQLPCLGAHGTTCIHWHCVCSFMALSSNTCSPPSRRVCPLLCQ